jgi:hypothetical protein
LNLHPENINSVVYLLENNINLKSKLSREVLPTPEEYLNIHHKTTLI